MKPRANAPPHPRRSGRPSREDAELLSAHIVACAARLFLRDGYAGVAMENVATIAGVGKNTLYRRYASKSDLFQAVVDHQIRKLLPPPNELAAGSDLATGLRRVAVSLVEAALNPETTALQRLIIAEAERFPEISAICLERAYHPAIAIARAVLERMAPTGTASGLMDFAAEQFVAGVAYGPHLHALLGRRVLGSSEDISRYVDRVVTLFLAGWRTLTGTA